MTALAELEWWWEGGIIQAISHKTGETLNPILGRVERAEYHEASNLPP